MLFSLDCRCAKCKNADYCSKECQKKHWAEHKKRCKQFTAAMAESKKNAASDNAVPDETLS